MRIARSFAYFNFEEPGTAGIESGDMLKLCGDLTETYGKFDIHLPDKIQNIHGWEKFVRSISNWFMIQTVPPGDCPSPSLLEA